MRYFFQCLAVVAIFATLVDPAQPQDSASGRSAKFRRPSAVVLSHDQQHLWVANHRSGTISVVDCASQKVVSEVKVADQLSDLTAAGRTVLLATDAGGGELLILRVDGVHLDVQRRIAVPPYPAGVVATGDGKQAFVASLWPRQLTKVDLQSGKKSTLDLPFAPREQLLVRDDGALIVADAFGGRLGVVDPDSVTLRHVLEFPAHHIRGLATSPDGSMLVVSHQMLNELAHTVRNDVHWGLLMSNDLRWLRLDSVLGGADDLYEGAHMHPLGEPNSATADPAALLMTARGEVVVALGGVGEIAYGRETDFSMQRLAVGRRPTAIVASDDGRWIYVANTFDDSITIIDMDQHKPAATIALGAMPKSSLADRGELLFHDARLSHDGWMTCQSCHVDGHTNGLLNDNFSDHSFGAPKRVLSLLSNTDTAPFAWNGEAKTLRDQIRNSIENTMQSATPASDEQLAALQAYLETLKLPPSIDELRGRVDRAAIARGGRLFESLDCNACHRAPTYTSPEVYDVGLTDQLGRTQFNPPSLRGVGHRGPLFHDNRAATLRSVFADHQHQLSRPLSDAELDDLTAFLRSL